MHRIAQNINIENSVTTKEALAIAKAIGLDFDQEDFPIEEFRRGIEVEREHGPVDEHDGGADTNVTQADPYQTAKIAWAHLRELPDYYTRLDKMEQEAEKKEMMRPSI